MIRNGRGIAGTTIERESSSSTEMTEIDTESSSTEVKLHNEQLERYLRDIDFESLSAEETLRWATATFSPDRAVLSTSFQAAGVAMIHMASELQLGLRVATVDTLRLHPETYAFMREVEERYGIDIEVQRPDPDQVRSMVDRFGEYLFFDNKARQEYCCQVRKTRPHDKLLKTADCWLSGLRRDQSPFRVENTPKATTVTDYGTPRQLLKLNPMADWPEERILRYVEENDVPKHPLYAQGYGSIGCFICSTPTSPGEPKRAGRWRWFNSDEKPNEEDAKECGLHVPMYNI